MGWLDRQSDECREEVICGICFKIQKTTSPFWTEAEEDKPMLNKQGTCYSKKIWGCELAMLRDFKVKSVYLLQGRCYSTDNYITWNRTVIKWATQVSVSRANIELCIEFNVW